MSASQFDLSRQPRQVRIFLSPTQTTVQPIASAPDAPARPAPRAHGPRAGSGSRTAGAEEDGFRAPPSHLAVAVERAARNTQLYQGRRFWNEVSVTPLRDPHGVITYYFGTHKDVTVREEADRALSLSEQRFRQMFESNTTIKLVIDQVTGNLTAARYYGHTRGARRPVGRPDQRCLDEPGPLAGSGADCGVMDRSLDLLDYTHPRDIDLPCDPRASERDTDQKQQKTLIAHCLP